MAPFSVINAYRYHWMVTHKQQEAMEAQASRLSRVNAIVHDFMDGHVSDPVYHAAILMPLMDKTTDELQSRNAYRALKVHNEESRAEERTDTYILGLITDRPIVKSFWDSRLKDIAADLQEAGLSEAASALTPERADQPVDKMAWLHEPGLTPLTHVESLLDDVNLESLMIQAAELLEWFESDKAGNDSKTLSYVYAAESLFAPLAEIIGFDGLASALLNACTIIRFKNAGEEVYLERAAQILEDRAGRDTLDSSVQATFEAALGETLYDNVLNNKSNHEIIIGEGFTHDDARVIWRLKSLGSLAKKLKKNDIGTIPLDIIGATVVLPDLDQTAQRFATMIQAVRNNESLSLTPAPSREQAIHIKGSPEYIEAFQLACGYESLEAMQEDIDVVEVSKDKYQVAKITFVYISPEGKRLNTEIQFNTEQDRIEARTGSAAHIAIKYLREGQKIDPEILKRIRARKDHMREQILVPDSQIRANHLAEVLKSAQFA